MATYNPPTLPSPPKQSSRMLELRYRLQLSSYRYQIDTAMYVMSPGEKLAYNLLLTSMCILFCTAICYYVPLALQSFFSRVARYVSGDSRLSISDVDVVVRAADVVVQGSRQAVASLAEGRGLLIASLPFAV